MRSFFAMKATRPLLQFLVFSLCASASAQSKPEGVLFVAPTESSSDSLVMPLVYTEVKSAGRAVIAKKLDGSSENILNARIKSLVPVPDLDGDFSSKSDFDSLRAALKDLQEAKERFPKAEALTSSVIAKIEPMLERGDSGQVLFNGKWTTPAEMAASAGQPRKGRTITTLSGTTYTGVKISRSEPSALQIMNSRGVARIPFTDLPENIKEEFDYDPEKAADYERELAKMKAAKMEAQQKGAEEQRRIASLRESAEKKTLYVMQITSDGALVNPQKSRAIASSSARVGGGGYVGASYIRDRSRIYFVRNPPPDLVDNDKFEAWIVEDGTFSYTNTLGAQNTVKAYRAFSAGRLGIDE